MEIATNREDTMRHTITASEAAQINKSRAKYAQQRRAEIERQQKDREAAELAEWESRMELKYNTQ